ncbi:MAG: hypothetical protein ACH37Z_12260 [Anaerolineae bacterium]
MTKDPRHILGEMVARESSLPRKLTKALHGQPLISHRADKDDLDRLEWELSRTYRGMTDDIKRIKLVENNRVITNGMPERWRRLEVTLWEAPDVAAGSVILCIEQKPVRDWLVACLAEQPKYIAVCHTAQWDVARRWLQSAGYIVTNADAPYTPHSEPWVIPGARQ